MNHINILAANTDADKLAITVKTLEPLGAALFTAGSRAEVLKTAENTNIHIFICGTTSPLSRAIETIDMIHSRNPDIVCIALTNGHGAKTVLEALSSGEVFAFLNENDCEKLLEQVQAAAWHHARMAESRRMIDCLQKENQKLKEALTDSFMSDCITPQQRMLAEKRVQFENMRMLQKINHHFRQPLNILALAVQDLEDAYQSDRIDREYVDNYAVTYSSTIQKMSRLLNSAYICFESCDETVDFDPSKELEKIAVYAGKQCKLKNIAMTYGTGSSKPLMLRGSKSDFRKAVLNIADNAMEAIQLKMSGDTGFQGKLDISLDTADACLMITVTDNGTGMKEDVKQQVFEPFFTTKTAAYGFGVSMFFTKFIIENIFDGSVWYSTAQNAGTKCFIIIPLRSA